MVQRQLAGVHEFSECKETHELELAQVIRKALVNSYCVPFRMHLCLSWFVCPAVGA